MILYIDYGGESGAIVKGKNLGYSTGYTHIDDSRIVFNEKSSV